MTALGVTALALSGCGTSPAGPLDIGPGQPDSRVATDQGQPAPADRGRADQPANPSCTPTTHTTEGFQGDLEIQRYRWIGGHPDGRRVAVLRSHFGPSSRAPFAILWVLEAENAKPLLEEMLFLVSGGEDELAQLEKTLLEQQADALRKLGIEEGQHRPQTVPYCLSSDGQIFASGVGPFRFTTRTDPCPADPKTTIAEWGVCSSGSPDRCIEHKTLAVDPAECWNGVISLVDLYQTNGVLWVVAEQKVEPLPGLFFRPRQLVGGTL